MRKLLSMSSYLAIVAVGSWLFWLGCDSCGSTEEVGPAVAKGLSFLALIGGSALLLTRIAYLKTGQQALIMAHDCLLLIAAAIEAPLLLIAVASDSWCWPCLVVFGAIFVLGIDYFLRSRKDARQWVAIAVGAYGLIVLSNTSIGPVRAETLSLLLTVREIGRGSYWSGISNGLPVGSPAPKYPQIEEGVLVFAPDCSPCLRRYIGLIAQDLNRQHTKILFLSPPEDATLTDIRGFATEVVDRKVFDQWQVWPNGMPHVFHIKEGRITLSAPADQFLGGNHHEQP